jgi:hypothetical protein
LLISSAFLGDTYAYWLRMETVCSASQFVAAENCSLDECFNASQLSSTSSNPNPILQHQLQQFLLSQPTILEVIKSCTEAEPRHGELWTILSKHDSFFASSIEILLFNVTKCITEIVPNENIQIPFVLSSL